MDPISAVRDRIASWLDDSPPPKAGGAPGLAPAKEVDIDALPLYEHNDEPKFLFALEGKAESEPEKVAGKLYTLNPSEVPVRSTELPAQRVVDLARAHWPELTEEGAKTLAAQWAYETTHGTNCYNFNFGNVKQPNLSQPHMFLAGTWELCETKVEAASVVASSRGLAHLASDGEKRAKGIASTTPMVVFDPPSIVSSFGAYRTADEGMAAWVAFEQRIVVVSPGYVEALNRGDIPTMARMLSAAHYSTGTEEQYRAGVTRGRLWIEQQLSVGTR
jgi:hypothetical protein